VVFFFFTKELSLPVSWSWSLQDEEVPELEDELLDDKLDMHNNKSSLKEELESPLKEEPESCTEDFLGISSSCDRNESSIVVIDVRMIQLSLWSTGAFIALSAMVDSN
jgi:hypothetical protein